MRHPKIFTRTQASQPNRTLKTGVSKMVYRTAHSFFGGNCHVFLKQSPNQEFPARWKLFYSITTEKKNMGETVQARSFRVDPSIRQDNDHTKFNQAPKLAPDCQEPGGRLFGLRG
jgi:hypothetical protein